MPRRKFISLQKHREAERVAAGSAAPPLPVESAPVVSPYTDSVSSTDSPILAEPESTEVKLADSAHTNDKPIDLFQMTLIDRMQLNQGVSVNIMVGDSTVIELPRRLFEATSIRAKELLGDQNQIRLPGNADLVCVIELVQWLKETTYKDETDKLKPHYDLVQDGNLCHVAYLLGMGFYTHDIAEFHRKKIFRKVPSAEEIAFIEALADDKDDTFLNFVADRIAYIIRRGQAPSKEFTDFVANQPLLTEALEAKNAPWIERQRQRKEDYEMLQAQRMEAQAARDERQRQHEMWLESRAQRQAGREDRQKDSEARTALLRKMGGKIVSLTREEIELRDRLRARGDRAFM